MGTDVVQVTDDKVIVFASNEMPDWTVREFCVVPIHFRCHKFHLKRKAGGPPPYAFHYELGVWHAGLGMESNLPIYYDEDYVAERDRRVRAHKRHGHLHSALCAVYPFLGFGWSGFKERVLAVVGFDPIAVTEASIMLAVAFWFLEGLFVCYFQVGFLTVLFGHRLLGLLDFPLFFLLPLDSAIRFGRVTSGDSTLPNGFLEWLFRRTPPHAGPR